MRQEGGLQYRQRRHRARSQTRKRDRDEQEHAHHKKHHHHEQQNDSHRDSSDAQVQATRSDRASSVPKVDANSNTALQEAPSLARQPVAPVSSQPSATTSASLPPPSVTAPRAPVTTASATKPAGGSMPSIAVIAGAVMGGIVLLLVLATVFAYKCSGRKKATINASSRVVGVVAPGDTSPMRNGDLVEKHSASETSTLQGHPPAHKHGQFYNSRGVTVQERGHLTGLQQRSNGLPAHGGGQRGLDFPAPPVMHKSSPEALGPNYPNHHQGNLPTPDDQVELGHRASLRDGERTCEGDDGQIDRCLSYYMKRHTRASMHPDTTLDLPSPLPRRISAASPAPETQDRVMRRSFKFPKTANLLEKIRRSQIRLNEEALAQARKEGHRISRPTSQARSSVQGAQAGILSPFSDETEASRYDVSDSFGSTAVAEPTGQNLPAHWRSSATLNRTGAACGGANDQDVLGSSPAVSEPHSAFEYADYYDSYLPHTSIRLQPADDGDVEDDFALPWQNHSPCRSSALSPRLSSSVSMRQRSATFSQASPLAWPRSANTDTTADGGALRRTQSHLSAVADPQRGSPQADEVIRF